MNSFSICFGLIALGFEPVQASPTASSAILLIFSLNSTFISFSDGTFFTPIQIVYDNKLESFDTIISNPPYIDIEENIDNLVKNNEPHLALYAPNNGLYCYEEILKNARNYLNDKALIAFEIGEKQGESLKELSLKYLGIEAKIEKDLQT